MIYDGSFTNYKKLSTPVSKDEIEKRIISFQKELDVIREKYLIPNIVAIITMHEENKDSHTKKTTKNELPTLDDICGKLEKTNKVIVIARGEKELNVNSVEKSLASMTDSLQRAKKVAYGR